MSVIPRLDLNPCFSTVKGEGGEFTLGNSSLYSLFEGNITENLSFSVCNHWAGFDSVDDVFATTKDLYAYTLYSDTTNWLDWAYLTYTAGPFVTPDSDPADIDKAARAPMNEVGLDFNHGIAHGVGHVLSVHEGPITIKKDRVPIPLQPGMIMSNEPGFYKEGSHGVRIENLIAFADDGEGNIVNEPLTCVPYERKAINKDLLTDKEIEYVDKYHEWVRKTLTPLLDEETAAWLERETAAL